MSQTLTISDVLSPEQVQDRQAYSERGAWRREIQAFYEGEGFTMVGRKTATEASQSEALSSDLRLYLAIIGRVQNNQSTVFGPGEARRVLGKVDPATGKVRPAKEETVRGAIRKLAAAGLVDEDSHAGTIWPKPEAAKINLKASVERQKARGKSGPRRMVEAPSRSLSTTRGLIQSGLLDDGTTCADETGDVCPPCELASACSHGSGDL